MTTLSSKFTLPLLKAGGISLLLEEWKDIVDYSKRYLNLVQEPYQVIWWKLFNASCCSKWSNILDSGRTFICIPVTNGHIEHVFSTLKLIKTDLHSTPAKTTLMIY